MKVAVRSTAVVTSLFPKAVHDRLFGETKEEDTSHREKDLWMARSGRGIPGRERRSSVRSAGGTAGAIGPLPSLGEDDAQTDDYEGAMTNSSGQFSLHESAGGDVTDKKKRKKKVIADKYAATTVFFADLAGFTKWSSTREPEQVFELLEALYGAFDKIALRRAVFKVETIGDCYMAVTGLPNPQPDHAVRAVKFARDSMLRMERILYELQHTLGQDTLELAMRVGLHSGPVTAGVLRGDKGRFQLFGDTVNTASRMESNGVKGRIHCSQSTADLLPPKWLTLRPDKVVAKGKGEMQTYFVNASMDAKSAASGLSLLSEGDAGFVRSLTQESTESPALPQEFSEGDRSKLDDVSELDFSETKDITGNLSFKDESTSRADEDFINEPPATPRPESAPAAPSRLAKFSDSLAKALKLADEISV